MHNHFTLTPALSWRGREKAPAVRCHVMNHTYPSVGLGRGPRKRRSLYGAVRRGCPGR